MSGLLLLALALIIYGSLYPFEFDFAREHGLLTLLHSWPARFDRFELRDAAVNVLLYVPLGATVFLQLARRFSRAIAIPLAVACGLGLSFSLELLQAYEPLRVSSLIDVLTNSAGAFAGAIAGALFQPRIERLVSRKRGSYSPPALLLITCWFSYQLYPFIPILSRTRIRLGLAALAQLSGISSGGVWTNAAGWFAAGLALEALVGEVRAWWLGLLMLCLPARFVIPGRAPATNEVLGAVVALIAWSVLSHHARGRMGLWLVLTAIIVTELEPFRFLPAAQPFSWIPFAASFEAERQAAVIVLFDKAFFYGTAVWFGNLGGWPYAAGGLLLAAVLLVLEWVQRHLPGRTPEITDAVLALLMAWSLSLLAKKKKAAGLIRRDVAPR